MRARQAVAAMLLAVAFIIFFLGAAQWDSRNNALSAIELIA
jgi:hypothetical protein